MTITGWCIVAVVAVLIPIVVGRLRSGTSNAMGFTNEFGYCPNMGACSGCDVCEED